MQPGHVQASETDILREKVRFLTQAKLALERDLEYYKNEVSKLLSPPLIEATVIDVIDSDRVIVRSSSGPNLLVNVASNVDRGKLKPGVAVVLNSRGSTIVDVLPDRVDPLVSVFVVEEAPSVTFEDVGGLDSQLREIYEAVILPLKNPQVFVDMGIEPPKGVLFHGPPGTGKTLVARAIAREAGATFISLSASSLLSKFVGEGARLVRELFKLARAKAPSIVFIDEIDAIGGRRVEVGTSGEREVHRTLAQLLVELDGFSPLSNVRILAATNRLDALDPALLRPGRFDKLIEFPLPDKKGRLSILRIHTRRVPLAPDVDLEEIAATTEGFSGAELKLLVVEAAYNAIRRHSKIVTAEDFKVAIEKVKTTRSKKYQESSLTY
ncbi:MAG: proteasome-activating nucleotidase [Acidilobaceae archaeon]